MNIAAMQAAQHDVESRVIMFEYAEFGSLNRLLKKTCEPVLTADDPRKARNSSLLPSPSSFSMSGDGIFQVIRMIRIMCSSKRDSREFPVKG